MGRERVSGEPGVERPLRRAAWVLAWEIFWRLAWPLPAWAALVAALVLLDLLPLLPPLWHRLALAGLALALFALLVRLRQFRWPDRTQCQRRLERDNRLAHRPFSQLEDRPANDGADARLLWRLQRHRILTQLAHLRLAWPAPGIAARDPWGVRFAPLLLLAIGLAVGRHSVGERLDRALDIDYDRTVPPPVLQVWITPPAYTRQPPRLLQNDSTDLRIPVGSTLLAELQGALKDARLEIDRQSVAFARLDSQSQRLETKLVVGHRLTVRSGWHRLAGWPIELVPDRPPQIGFVGPPKPESDGTLTVSVAADDDYGVLRIGLLLGRPELGPEEQEIALTGGGQPQLTVTQRVDLTAHPWSGLMVSLRPFAEDGAGQRGFAPAVMLRLPERLFHHPVAQAVAAVRRGLAQDPAARPAAVARITGLLERPDDFGGDLAVYLQLTTARSRLMIDQTNGAIASVMDLLWAAALRIEDGDLPDARRQVEDAGQALADALAKGASDSDIARLTEQLNQAMRGLLDTLAKRATAADGASPEGSGARGMTADQLQAMFEQMRSLAQLGARQAAGQTLQKLRDLLDHLDVAGPSSRAAQQLRDGAEKLRQLTELQKGLLDRAFRRKQAEPSAMSAEAKAEDALQEQLRALQQALPSAAPALDQALADMKGASQSLRDQQNAEAILEEGRALDKLQQGARQVEAALAQAGKSGGASGQDPLGRALADGPGQDQGNVKLPSPTDLGKSREILDELRRRAADAGRPASERDYLRRLLDRLY